MAQKAELKKEGNSISKQVTETLLVYDIDAALDEEGVNLVRERMIGSRKDIWQKLA